MKLSFAAVILTIGKCQLWYVCKFFLRNSHYAECKHCAFIMNLVFIKVSFHLNFKKLSHIAISKSKYWAVRTYCPLSSVKIHTLCTNQYKHQSLRESGLRKDPLNKAVMASNTPEVVKTHASQN